MRNTIGGVAHGAPAFVEGVFCMCNGSAILISSLVQDVEYIWWCCAWGACLR